MSEPDSPEARRRAIELLEANHVFPGDISVSVIARNDEDVAARILAAAEGVAAILTAELGWTPARRERAIADYRAAVASSRRWRDELTAP